MQDRRRETSMFPGRDGLTTISFAQRMLTSEGFKTLFREGMALVEETAAYLDGPGRQESRALNRQNALAYASESMRLTTRLMQLTSWLLLQRAVNEGELSREDAEREHSRVKVSPQDIASAPEMFVLLPIALRTLVERSLRLQERILRLDGDLKGSTHDGALPSNPVGNQLGMLQQAFAAGQG
jgi:regulator of CtrA degradation